MWEEAVRIPVGQHTLKGNLVGGGERQAPAVLFLHGWGGVRGGPHNLLTNLARNLAAAGIPSLRFDFRGRGESDLDPEEITLGHMGDDAVAAARFLASRLGRRPLWIVGICSGGNVGIGIIDRLPEVAGMWLLSVYPFGEADSFSRDARRTAHFLKLYWDKLWQPRTWQRIVRGEISYGGVLRVLTNPFRKDKRRADNALQQEQPESQPQPPRRSPLDKLLLRPIPVQITYGDADPDFQPSYDYFEAFQRKNDYTMHLTTIAGANHNFYSEEWKRQLADSLNAMIEENP